jgi:hypothetical protein
MIRGLDAPRLRVVLTEVLSGERSDLKRALEGPRLVESDAGERAAGGEGSARARAGSAG